MICSRITVVKEELAFAGKALPNEGLPNLFLVFSRLVWAKVLEAR